MLAVLLLLPSFSLATEHYDVWEFNFFLHEQGACFPESQDVIYVGNESLDWCIFKCMEWSQCAAVEYLKNETEFPRCFLSESCKVSNFHFLL